MEKNLFLYDDYKKSRILEEPDLSRFNGRLTDDEIMELAAQIMYLVLEAEEEAFLKGIELSTK